MKYAAWLMADISRQAAAWYAVAPPNKWIETVPINGKRKG